MIVYTLIDSLGFKVWQVLNLDEVTNLGVAKRHFFKWKQVFVLVDEDDVEIASGFDEVSTIAEALEWLCSK